MLVTPDHEKYHGEKDAWSCNTNEWCADELSKLHRIHWTCEKAHPFSKNGTYKVRKYLTVKMNTCWYLILSDFIVKR